MTTSRVNDVLLFRNMSKRNKIIASILVVVITTAVCTAFWNYYLKPEHKPVPVQQMRQPKPPAMLISVFNNATPEQQAQFASLPTKTIDAILLSATDGKYLGPSGASKHCGVHIGFWPTWKVNCWIIFQPGTTRALATWFARQGGTAIGAVVTTMTTLCAALSLGALAALCGIAATYWGAEIIWWTTIASNNMQCLRFRWTAQPDLFKPWIPIAGSFKVDAYGSWQTWMYAGDRRFWGYPTPCTMPRDCWTVTHSYSCII